MTWLFINSNQSLLEDLNLTIREKTLNFATKKLGRKFTSYAPWMCNIKNLEKLSYYFNNPSLILQDKKALSGIAPYYTIKKDDGDNLYPAMINSYNYNLYEKACNYLFSIPDLEKTFRSLVKHIVPLGSKKGSTSEVGAGSSTLLARGAIFLARPNMGRLSCIQLALNVAHELGHQSLMTYQTSDRIIEGDLATPTYSYIRKKSRPIIQSFHASFALAFMVKFLKEVDRKLLTRNELEFVESKIENIKTDFKNSLKDFDETLFTDFGAILLEDLKKYAKSL